MLKLAKYLMALPPVFIDGVTYVCIQVLTVLSTQFATDEAAKYIAPAFLFWLKIGIGELTAFFIAVKMFRSTSYARHQASKAGDTNFLARVQKGADVGTP